MIDPMREVTLVVGDMTYTLYTGNKALRLIERETGKSLPVLFEGLDDIGVETLTVLTWAALQTHHPSLTIDDIDQIIDVAGYDAIGEALNEAVSRALPTTSPNGESEASGKVRVGTGTRSSPTRSRRA